jgi:hypothetical protein
MSGAYRGLRMLKRNASVGLAATALDLQPAVAANWALRDHWDGPPYAFHSAGRRAAAEAPAPGFDRNRADGGSQ